MAGPDGTRHAEWNSLAGINSGLVITKECEMPEALVRYADYNFVPENGLQWTYGPLGHNLEKTADGKWGFLPTPAEYGGYGQFRISQTNPFMIGAIGAKWSAENFISSDRGVWKNYLIRDLWMPHADFVSTSEVKLTADEIAEAGVYLTDINSYLQSKEAEWVVNGRIEEEWDDYVKKLDDMGMQSVLDIYQRGADRWNQ
jgi:putative aldouronate transport system substrate-binding protein